MEDYESKKFIVKADNITLGGLRLDIWAEEELKVGTLSNGTILYAGVPAVRELKQLGVDVYFEEQNIHSLSTDGELMLTVHASYAQEESRSASENQKWCIKKNFEEGKPWSSMLLGYRFPGWCGADDAGRITSGRARLHTGHGPAGRGGKRG